MKDDDEPSGWRWRWVFKKRGFGATKWHIGERLSLNSPLRNVHQFEEEPLYSPSQFYRKLTKETPDDHAS